MSAVNSTSHSSSTSGTSSSTTPDRLRQFDDCRLHADAHRRAEKPDPTQPMSSQDLLGQLATMSQLQSTTDLDTALQSNTSNQQLSIGTSFIGKSIAGTDASGNAVSGVVTQAFLSSGTAYVGVGNSQVPLANITNVAATS